ncbi:succinylglutamate desuccinylase/aspartoacylase domain-containing protein [Rhodocista pekingensis]|uniref:Succinylglutamate desuccinylase/aspartoacylase family protein n=1 Tax=Rhodocista pekingensis TaxID=201185 RepID=A0ABW2KW45_9PROT
MADIALRTGLSRSGTRGQRRDDREESVVTVIDPIELVAPDIAPYRHGNTDIEHVSSITADEPGPHVLVNALMHGNELCGAVALDFLFRHGIRPRRGRLTLSFCNVAAYATFDPRAPVASRYVDEDMNRVWSPVVLDGPRDSVELRRARQLRPLFESADFLLDLHSMQNPTAPLMLCGRTARAERLARAVGFPAWIVADAGHAAGRRLIDHGRFADPDGHAVALLAECGQHWRRDTGPVAVETTLRFLLATGCIDRADAAPWLPGGPRPEPCLVEVTEAVTVGSDAFTFSEPYLGMEIIPAAGTVIASDGGRPVRTPYDDCILIMPSRRLSRGQTAVRLGRLRP